MTALPAEQRSEHLPNSFSEKAGAFAVLTAAGSGTRLGAAHPKALVQLAGRPLVHWAAEGLAAAGVKATAITAPPGHEDEIAALFSAGYCAQMRVHVVSGGANRQASVALGLAALAKQYLAETGCEIPADTVILAVGFQPDAALLEEMRDAPELYAIGDCRQFKNVHQAVWDAFEVANHI